MVYTVAAIAGFPVKCLMAYRSFQSSLQVRNALAQGLGEAHRRLLSIPQGCPWSMMKAALLKRAWVMSMRMVGTRARALADDLLLTSVVVHHLSQLIIGPNLTHLYTQLMGGGASRQANATTTRAAPKRGASCEPCSGPGSGSSSQPSALGGISGRRPTAHCARPPPLSRIGC